MSEPKPTVEFDSSAVAEAWDAGHAAAWREANERIARLEARLQELGEAKFVLLERLGVRPLERVRR